MLDVTNTAQLIEQLAGVSLADLRQLHGKIADAEQIVRAIIRQRESQERRDERLRERGLCAMGTP